MVKGRRGRVKALIPNTRTTVNNYIKGRYETRNCSPKLPNTHIGEKPITGYFKIQCLDNDDDCKSNIYKAGLGYNNEGLKEHYEDKFLMVVKENLNLPQTFCNAFIPKSPHRIQLNTFEEEESKLVGKYDDELRKSHLIKDANKKSKTKLQKTVATDHKLTDYFPIRRSIRKTKRIVLEEKQKNLEQLLRDGIEEGLTVHCFEGKGRGVIAAKPFDRGDFVVEYSGELLDVTEAKMREAKYAEDETTGCYMYYFKYLNQQCCIDATTESGRLGRLVNHSRNGNLITRTVVVDGYPHLVLIAKDHIEVGEEVCYDYGDRSKESLKNHPWLAL